MSINPTLLLQKARVSGFDRRNYAEGSATPRSAEVMQALLAFAVSQPDRSFLLPFFHWSTIEELDSAFAEALDYHLNDLEKCIAEGEDELAFNEYQLSRNKCHLKQLTEVVKNSTRLKGLVCDQIKLIEATENE